MKTRWSTILLLMLLCVWRQAASADTWALLVGVSKYQNPQISSLKYPSADAISIRDTLMKQGQVPEEHIKLLVDDQATRANILDAVQNFLTKGVKSGDQVVVFLAGHGVTKEVGAKAKCFLLSTDVKGLSTAALEDSAVSLMDLSAELSKLPAAQFVVFVDACREDPTPGRGVKGNLQTDVAARSVQITPKDPTKQSAVTVFACQVGQRAYEDPSYEHGVFTYFILDAIRDSKVRTNADGAVDMGDLHSYVKKNVEKWAEKTSKSGSFEVEQTPEMVAVNAPVVLMRIKPNTTADRNVLEPVLVISTDEGAQVSINGNKVSTGPVAEHMVKSGDNEIVVDTPGSGPLTKKFRGIDGYRELVDLRSGMARSATGKAGELYQRSLDAENRGQLEAAVQGYQLTLQEDPKYAPASERLAALQIRQGQLEDGITTLITLNTQMPTAHTYSLLSRAYSRYAMRDNTKKSEKNEEKKPKKGGGTKLPGGIKFPFASPGVTAAEGDFHTPKDRKDAISMAQKSAEEAVKLDGTSVEAQMAQGFALIAGDDKGKNRQASTAAFGKAVFLSPQDASANYGMGYALRYFSMHQKSKEAMKEDLKRAVVNLKEALKIRPNYYEAHRELAHCYLMLDDSTNAKREYEEASANRGGAEDADEVAGCNMALSAIYKKEGKEQESNGYKEDAMDLSKDLKRVVELFLRYGPGRGIPTTFGDALGRVSGFNVGNILGGFNPLGSLRFP